MTRYGFDVTYSHIDTGTDFFGRSDLNEYDAIVSNPPFSMREKILERLFESKAPFAIILNFNGLFDSRRRWKMFAENDFSILIPFGRFKFWNDSHSYSQPNFQSVYVCHGMTDKQIEFVEQPNRQIQMTL